MKQDVETTGKTVQLLQPDYKKAVEVFAGLGFVRNEQDVYLGKVKSRSVREFTPELCYCIDFYNGKKREFSALEQTEYAKSVACISFFGNETDTFAAQDIEIEVLRSGSTFEYNGVFYKVPLFVSGSEPYVLSLVDALEMFHRVGFVNAGSEDIFIGTFSFLNREAENMVCPEAQKHFGVGVSYMIEAEVDDVPSVAVIRAFNEMVPKTVICLPLLCAVVRRYLPHDSFRTVCGEMALIDGSMVNYGHWLKDKLNQIHDVCRFRPKLQFC